MTDLSAHLLNSTKPFLTSNTQENHFTDKKPWNGDGERWGGRGCSLEDKEWVSSVGSRHPCRKLVLRGILRSQTCSENQRNMTSHRFKKTTWRMTTGGRPWGSTQPFWKAWLSTTLLRTELFFNVSKRFKGYGLRSNYDPQ